MKCADPVLCYITGKDKKIYRNFSLVPRTFLPLKPAQVFNCGKCIFCRKKRAYELASRCVLHASLYKQNCFLTLTYDEKKQTYHNNFEYADIQKFKKRLRQHCKRNYNGKKIEIFNVHEYGKNGKKHWHLIVFNHDFSDKETHARTRSNTLYTSRSLTCLWPYGFSTVGDVTAASAMYQAQYCEKDFKNGNVTNEKKSHSKHSGIGRPYFLAHYRQILQLGYIPVGGGKLPIPRYFQKIAHKHWSHFYQPENFFDNKTRKALYRPFKKEEPDLEIATLYNLFSQQKQERVKELESEWSEFIAKHLTTKDEADFIKSASNTIYDLKHKPLGEQF